MHLTLYFIENPFNIFANRADPDQAAPVIVQALISVQALVFDLAQLTCQKRFDYRNAILGSSAILLGNCTVKLW